MAIVYLHKTLDTNEIFMRIMKTIFQKKIIIGQIDLLDVLLKNFKFEENQTWSLLHSPASI